MFMVQWCKCRLYTARRYSIIYYHNLDIYLHTKNSGLKFQISHITSGGLCASNFLCKYTHYPGVLSFPITYRKASNTKKVYVGTGKVDSQFIVTARMLLILLLYDLNFAAYALTFTRGLVGAYIVACTIDVVNKICICG